MKKFTIALVIALPTIALPMFSAAATDVVNNRQQAFSSIEKVSKHLDSELSNSDVDWQKVGELSEVLVNHGEVLNASFAEGDTGGKAKKEIWSKPEKFNQLMVQMNQGFAELYQASVEQDLSSAEQGLNSANKTCKGCHRTYRSRW
ncbi:cytochrome c [Vibrio sp. 10N.261.46.E12]|uniref:c-type cytochrome n=1 Tax=unclassified Vibrio TaxID=2614977 RepID=UPI000977C607|nr:MULTISPECIES: cytochrome c [unclassified Vibrio]OMO38083.1 cytochrome C [Vibrio sp. 10N.261.45.E1]PMJ27503.1 cytochrome C [Vibrio sp. 10N.286.45.B6]PML89929.1 cytochrome C [Vibrio sp. 10N.261.49.E11]PMM64767.1 cytochrome C [Vibrio sp. 10N.261.46.F12]PMM84420.1 cytochrome C [Vibrio sp. 10N.261.46.E8]